LFNRSEKAEKISAVWKDLGFTGRMKVRDLWEHADRGIFAENYSVEVPSHAAVVIKVSRP
jgi:alpha-galactosidase